MAIILKNLHDTAKLGEIIAKEIQENKPYAIFLKGDLGAGKTELARHILANLPGAENCEFSSPSFTICNIYPSTPPMLHCDLYRCQHNIPEDIYEALNGDEMLAVVEWAEYFPKNEMPAEYLDITFKMDNYLRLLDIKTRGNFPKQVAEKIFSVFNQN